MVGMVSSYSYLMNGLVLYHNRLLSLINPDSGAIFRVLRPASLQIDGGLAFYSTVSVSIFTYLLLVAVYLRGDE